MKKTIFSLFAAFVFSVSLLGLQVHSASAFSDVTSSNRFFDAVDYADNQGYIDGYPDGTFRPFDPINRAEFTKIIIAIDNDAPRGSNCFPDVGGDWYAPYVCQAKSMAVISGYPDGTFKPSQYINLAEALKIIFEAQNLDTGSAGNNWYDIYLSVANSEGYLAKVTKNPSNPLLRGEMVQIIYNIQNPGVAEDDTADVDDNRNEDSNSDSSNNSGGNIDLTRYFNGNQYSWDGSWTPTSTVAGLIDEKYDGTPIFDGAPTPVLPPGKWDWNESNNDFANYRNFAGSIGTWEMLKDSAGLHFGWRLVGINPSAIDYAGPAAYFEGTPGTDILNLGRGGFIHSFTNGNLGDGPDVLVFDRANTLDFKTGSSLSGSSNDNDLVIAGCVENSNANYDINTTTIHTGPGDDLVFVRDMERAAIDAGNGDGGITSKLDPTDGDDVVIFRGNMGDFRFFGGNGNDVAVWYLDDIIQNQNWLYPNFFGGGGSGEAIWGDNGTDRLVLVIDPNTPLVDQTPTGQGELLLRIDHNYPSEIVWDMPVYHDIYARYCIHCGQSPSGRKTLTLEYLSPDGSVHTGYFYVTAFEQLQIGLGSNAKVYELDDVNGTAILNNSLGVFEPPQFPAEYCE